MESGIYEHYKGGKYLVLGLGQHTETNEIVVVYVPLYYNSQEMFGPRIRVRPKDGPEGFCSYVKIPNPMKLAHPDDKINVPRFKYIGTGE